MLTFYKQWLGHGDGWDLNIPIARLKASLINPFLGIEPDSGFDAAYLQQIAPQAAICMGLACRRVDDK